MNMRPMTNPKTLHQPHRLEGAQAGSKSATLQNNVADFNKQYPSDMVGCATSSLKHHGFRSRLCQNTVALPSSDNGHRRKVGEHNHRSPEHLDILLSRSAFIPAIGHSIGVGDGVVIMQESEFEKGYKNDRIT